MKTMMDMIWTIKQCDGPALPDMPSWLKCSVSHLLDLAVEDGVEVLVDKVSRKRILCRESVNHVVLNEHLKCGHGRLEQICSRVW